MKCLSLLRLLLKLTGKRSIELFGVFQISPNHSRIINPKQANAPSLVRPMLKGAPRMHLTYNCMLRGRSGA